MNLSKLGFKRSMFVFTLFFFICGLILPQDLSTPVGYWEVIDEKTQEIKSIAKIYLKGDQIYGKLVKLFPKPDEDQNPVCDKCKGELKDQPILGMEFMEGFKGKASEWEKGKILDPENGKTYHCQLEMTDGGKRLKVFGYIRVIVKLGRSQIWRRADLSKYSDILE